MESEKNSGVARAPEADLGKCVYCGHDLRPSRTRKGERFCPECGMTDMRGFMAAVGGTSSVPSSDRVKTGAEGGRGEEGTPSKGAAPAAPVPLDRGAPMVSREGTLPPAPRQPVVIDEAGPWLQGVSLEMLMAMPADQLLARFGGAMPTPGQLAEVSAAMDKAQDHLIRTQDGYGRVTQKAINRAFKAPEGQRFVHLAATYGAVLYEANWLERSLRKSFKGLKGAEGEKAVEHILMMGRFLAKMAEEHMEEVA